MWLGPPESQNRMTDLRSVEPDFVADLEAYHQRAVEAHKVEHERRPGLPELPQPVAAATRAAQPPADES